MLGNQIEICHPDPGINGEFPRRGTIFYGSGVLLNVHMKSIFGGGGSGNGPLSPGSPPGPTFINGGEIMNTQHESKFVQLTYESPDEPQRLVTEFLYPEDFEDLVKSQNS